MAACQHWLASQSGQNWLLFFDNADNVQLDLAAFFPSCRFGNILVTTRNQHLSIHAGEDGDAKVTGMDPEDAKYLLLSMSQSEKTHESEKLAKLIVKVLLRICFFLIITFKLIEDLGAPSFCIGCLSSCKFHSSLLFTQSLSKALSNAP